MPCPFGGPNGRRDRSQAAAAPIEEVPPDMKPEGENSVWIPGYWSWDDERQDFIWVSGVWRVPPPGYQWMPGYWQDVPGQGFQWVSGYWMPSAAGRNDLSAPAAAKRRDRTHQHCSGPELLLDPGPLAMERRPLCLAARLLGGMPTRLDLGAGDLLLESARLGLRARLLGLSLGPPRTGLFAGVFRRAGGRLPAGDLP